MTSMRKKSKRPKRVIKSLKKRKSYKRHFKKSEDNNMNEYFKKFTYEALKDFLNAYVKEEENVNKSVRCIDCVSIGCIKLENLKKELHYVVSIDDPEPPPTGNVCEFCNHKSCTLACLECGEQVCPLQEQRIQRATEIQNRSKVKPIQQLPTTMIRKSSNAGVKKKHPLCVGVNKTFQAQCTNCGNDIQISLNMVLDALGYLEHFRVYSSIEEILSYLKLNNPVSISDEKLYEELLAGLKTAFNMGAVEISDDGLKYRLRNPKERLDHVNLFWEIYLDTMSPLKPKEKSNKKSYIDDDYDENEKNSP